MRHVAVCLLVLACLTFPSCGGAPDKPPAMTPEKEKQLLQQIEKSRQAEGAAARK
jgi:hypothetical protein